MNPPEMLPVVVMVDLFYSDHDEDSVFHPYCKHRFVVRGLKPKQWQKSYKGAELTEGQRKLVLEKLFERLTRMEGFNLEKVKDWMITMDFVQEYSVIELDDPQQKETT